MQQTGNTLQCRDPRELAGLPQGAPVLVALSGGADSVALLSLMAEKPPIYAVHVHHGIRGEEADRDAEFCRTLAAKLGVALTVLYVDAPRLAAISGESLETAARNARYDAIASYMQAQGLPLLVTAHHADDQLETMLQHLLRGSGTRGLCGIPACRTLKDDLLVARPLLGIPKTALLQYLEQRQLPFVTDSTNEDICCQRNFLRLRVLPLLRELQPNAAEVAARCAASLAGDEAYLDGLAADFLAREGAEPSVNALLELPKPILVRVLRRLLPNVPTAAHVGDICRLLESNKPHRALSLPPFVTLRVEGNRLLVLQNEKEKNEAQDYAHILTLGENQINGGRVRIVIDDGSHTVTPKDANLFKYTTKLSLNSAMIKGKLMARPRQEGDRILVGGMHRAVRRLRALAQLPLATRRHMPLLVDDEGVVAVPFFTVRDGLDHDASLTVTFYFN